MYKNISNKNDDSKNIYGAQMGVPEMVLSDFKHVSDKLFIRNKYFSENKGIIVFYAPWCGHCQKLSNLIFDLAYSYMNVFPFAAVNCENLTDKNNKLCEYANIEKYPTLKYVTKNGSLEDYKNPVDTDHLIFFINSQI